MQATSALYRRLMADENHFFETRVVIGESGNLITENNEQITFGGWHIVVARSNPESGFGENILWSVSTNHSMFNNDPEIGQAIAGEIDIQMLNPSGDIPRMSVVIPYVRVRTEDEQSEWIQQGVFYIDTREVSKNDDNVELLTLHGFDAMLKAEQAYAETNLNWPAKDIDIVREIAGKMGVSVDQRTVQMMTGNYKLPLPTNYSMREYFGYIASMYVGCFIMSDIGELRLVSLLELPPDKGYLVDNAGYSITFGGTRILV